MVLAESADSGFINRSFVKVFAPAGRFSIRIGVWYSPLHSHPFTTPSFGYVSFEMVGGASDLYHIVLRWTRWYHACL